MAVATADWNSAMNGSGVCANGGPEEHEPDSQERPSPLCIVSEPRVQVAGSTAEDFNVRVAVRLDAEAAAECFKAVALPLSPPDRRVSVGISSASIAISIVRRTIRPRSLVSGLNRRRRGVTNETN